MTKENLKEAAGTFCMPRGRFPKKLSVQPCGILILKTEKNPHRSACESGGQGPKESYKQGGLQDSLRGFCQVAERSGAAVTLAPAPCF